MKELAFQGKWRSYQQKILDNLAGLLADDGLHIVAAPGSGKTLLGLEVMRRLGEPALILAPSRTIRDQWAQRLCTMFLPAGTSKPEWISHDIRSPGDVTIITYQALHAAFSGEASEEEPNVDDEGNEDGDDNTRLSGPAKLEIEKVTRKVIAGLREMKIRTLILDEAHHLRNEWWKALTALKEALGKPTLVALTATPPYDVDPQEWSRYQELCGPIDDEISVPELVLQGDLCPHQDYVYFSSPNTMEAERLARLRGDIHAFVYGLLENPAFRNTILCHPWLTDPMGQVESILDDASFFSSMLIFLKEQKIDLPRPALDILGVKDHDFPALSLHWMEILLNGVFYSHRVDFESAEQTISSLQNQLRHIGGLEHSKVRLADQKSVQKLLASSVSKLDSILNIVRLESQSMGDDLRMVILSDYIRKEVLSTDPSNLRAIERMGVVPIFEMLRRSGLEHLRLGILTGSLIFIPAESKEMLDRIAGSFGIDALDIRYQPTAFDAGFVSVEFSGEANCDVVRLITELFAQGGIRVLVGTQALLGEGWDAPCVNTLILASTVGSYVLSNQMRGRAIRIAPQDPQKSSNIWHLAAIDPEKLERGISHSRQQKATDGSVSHPSDIMAMDLGSDVESLTRRFYAFEGLSFDSPPVIESGFQRLAPVMMTQQVLDISNVNRIMELKAADRKSLKGFWQIALRGNSAAQRMRQMLQSNYVPKGLFHWNTTKYLLAQSLAVGGLILNSVSGLFRVRFHSFDEMAPFLFAICCLLAVTCMPQTLKATFLLLRNGSLEGRMRQVGMAVVETLHHMGVVKTDLSRLVVKASLDESGIICCQLEGATAIERTYFFEAVREILVSTPNPRYILMRPSMLWWLRRTDFHAVPSTIGQKKENAERFAQLWNRYVGYSELVYTRSVQGRLKLLQYRTKSFASAFARKTDRLSRWE
jgi:superfamily II DNA or RNA helicase